MKKLGLILLTWLVFACAAMAQNKTCPTVATGDSSNACASTAFVGAAIGAGGTITGDVYFKSGRPWCDVRANGATGNGSTDDSAAYAACVTTLTPLGGGYIYAPPGHYCIKSGVNTGAGVSISIIGAGPTATILDACNTDVTVVTLAGSYSTLENVTVYGKGYPNDTTTFGSSHPAVILASTAGSTKLRNAYIYGGQYACEVNGNDARINNGICTFGYSGGLLVQGTNADGLEVGTTSFNQSWPVSTPSLGFSFSAWAPSTSYASGAIATNSNYFIQTTGACTSGSGSAPTNANYNVAFTDPGGGCTWKLVAPVQGYAVQCDTACVELFINNSDMGYSGRGAFGMTNSLAGTAPSIVTITDTEITGVVAAIDLKAGSIFTLKGSHSNGCYNTGCSIVLTEAAWSSQVTIIGNRIYSGQGANIFLSVGTLAIVSGNQLGGGVGTDVLVAANITDFVITDNVAGTITVNAGTSDHYTIAANDVTTVTDGGTGTHKFIINNQQIATACTSTAGAVQYNNSGVLGCITGFTSGGSTVTAGSGSLLIAGSSTGTTAIASANSGASNFTATIPAATDTFAMLAATQTLTNKTISCSSNTCSNIPNSALSLTTAQQMAFAPNTAMIVGQATGVNFNSANTDTAIAITLPTGYTRYMPLQIVISNASASITTATFGVFPAAGGSGTAVWASGSVITVSSASDATNNNAQTNNAVNPNTETFLLSGTPTLFFRVQTAQGSAATANVIITAKPLP